MIVEFYFISVTVLYLLTHLYLYLGFLRSLSLKRNSDVTLPKVSVVVAARNEEKNISRCIDSLAKLHYPKELLEVILVNDNSTDRTLELMLESTKDAAEFIVINSVNGGSGNLKGKANAIASAIEICTGEILISTDADCEVPPDWVKETVSYFEKGTGMVCGFTLIEFRNSLFAKLQCIDWMYLLSLASSSAGRNKILSCLGNNLSFSKSAYESTGGYPSIGFSVTEDLALMRRIDKDKKYEIRFPADKKCLVRTLPCRNIQELFSQKRRWFRGGTGINFLGYLIGIQLYSVNILLIFGLLFLNIKLFIVLIMIKSFSELLLLSNTFRIFEIKELYKFYPLFIFYFAFYGLTLPLSFLFNTRIKWKERKF